MPHYSKNPSAFPFAFFDIIRRAKEADGFLSFPPGAKRDAMSCRLRFYAFKKALAKSQKPEHKMLSDVAQDVSVFLTETDTGVSLRFSWRDDPFKEGELSFSPRQPGNDLRPGEVSHEEMMRRADHALALLNKSLAEGGGKVLTMAPDNATIQPVDSPKAIVAQEGGSTFAFVPEGNTSSTTIKEK